MTEALSADYVIVGSGAVGMAFADIILSESDASMIIVDQYGKPGGHWNVAYPFVKLHQPASFYGVSSKELSGGRSEIGGHNDGLGELSSGAEVSAYFDDVMRHQFLPSGRVQYFPMCTYEGDGTFSSRVSGQRYHAVATKKHVDATLMKTSVPSTHTPNFDIEPGVKFMPLNDLPRINEHPDGFVVIGAGKTGIDACLWLLEQGVDPDKITWIISRDSWFLDRRNTQMTEEFFFNSIGAAASQFESIAQATSPDDMFDRLVQSGYFLQLDPDHRPTMFHGATVTQSELNALREIKNTVRLGRVTSVGQHEICLDKGTIPTSPGTIHVDCSATPISRVEGRAVFKDGLITPQMIRPYQPVFSAAMIAHVELNYTDEAEKNGICGVVPLPDTNVDYMTFTLASLINQKNWRERPELQKWIAQNRLDGPSKLLHNIAEGDVEKIAVIKRIKDNAPAAAIKLMQFLQS